MTALRLDHVAIPVANAAASHRFYREVLELPLVQALSGEDWGGCDWLMMIFGLADGRQLALVALDGAAPAKDNLPRDARHLAFAATSKRELTTWKRRFEGYGVEHWFEDHGAQESLYFVDPDGAVLEITAPATPEVASTA